MLSLPKGVTQREFITTWRRFLKANHPDLNPDQTTEERARFKDAVSLWRR
jgi:DnaJ-class molecular chaperone